MPNPKLTFICPAPQQYWRNYRDRVYGDRLNEPQETVVNAAFYAGMMAMHKVITLIADNPDFSDDQTNECVNAYMKVLQISNNELLHSDP